MSLDNDTPRDRQSRGPLADIHPGGFAAVPNALGRDPRIKPGHIAAYYAVASCARGKPPFVVDAAYLRLQERSGLAEHALRRRLGQLQKWGYLRIERNPGNRNRYHLLPTQEAPEEVLAAEEAADRAATPEESGKRGGRPTKGGAQNSRDPLGDMTKKGGAQNTRGFGKGPAQNTRRTPAQNTRDSLEVVDRDIDIAGALAAHLPDMHQTLIAERIARLRKAVGTEAAYDALEEVLHRLRHPDDAGKPENPLALAREIAECYQGRCRTPDHADIHGDAARNYHRARRRDAEQKDRAAAALYRDRPQKEDPEVEELRNRDRVLADLRRLAAEEESPRRAAS